MAIDGFDYKVFAQSMAEQAKELVPKDLQPDEQEYIVNKHYKKTRKKQLFHELYF